MKKKAFSLEGEISSELKSYRTSQKRYAKRNFQNSNLNELLESVSNSHIVYLGDFHTFDQNSRNLERLTRFLLEENRKFTLGIEFVHINHQKHIDDFLAHYITEMEFLELIEYHDSWRFPWKHYRQFFHIARKNRIKVIALNSKGKLNERDQNAAKIISNYLQKDPSNRLLVLFGELHILPSKLPKNVKKLTSSKLTQTIIHQNLDEIFWKLNIKENQVVKFDEGEYSLQTSPPWIKYESMIYWYENLSEDPEFDIHDYIMNNGPFNFNDNGPENFIFLCKKLTQILSWDLKKEDIEDFNLYDHRNLITIQNKIEKIPKPSIIYFYKKLLHDGFAFRILFSTNYYCSSYSINRMAALAGMHIQAIALKSQNIDYEKIFTNKNQKQKFLLLIYQEIFAYFCSKIINPFRKCDQYQDFKKTLKNSNSSSQKNLNYFILDILDWDGSEVFDNTINGKNLLFLYRAAKKIGSYLGDIFYDNIFTKKDPSVAKLLNVLVSPTLTKKEFFELLRTLLPELEYKNHKKRAF